MEKPVLLTITATQRFHGEEPETSKLVTDGTMRIADGNTELSYEESELTGLHGTKTTFRIEPGRVVLTRSGSVQSQMVFSIGQEDHSLYDVGYGALMITVRGEQIRANLSENGGELEVSYAISIEDEAAGSIRYCIQVQPKAEE